MHCKYKKTFKIYHFCTPVGVLDLDTYMQLIFFGLKNVPQYTLPKMCIRPLLFQPFSTVPKNGHSHNSNLLVFTARMSSCMCVTILEHQDLLFIDLHEIQKHIRLWVYFKQRLPAPFELFGLFFDVHIFLLRWCSLQQLYLTLSGNSLKNLHQSKFFSIVASMR